MFDDITKEPEDMFEATDKAAPQVTPPTDTPTPVAPTEPRVALDTSSAPPAPPAPPAPVASPAPIAPPTGLEERVAAVSRQGGIPWKIILLIVAIGIVIGAAFALSMRILGARTPVTPTAPVIEDQTEAVQEPQEEEVVEEEPVAEVKEEVVSRKDTDKDGLTDEEEAEYGTSIRSEDTDSDGLFDLEEIRTWKTDPVNPDTDGDGYLDGEEVTGGYNPSGEGKLREPPNESS
jgi:hypothetical protein